MTQATTRPNPDAAKAQRVPWLRSPLSFGGAPIGNLYESVDDDKAAAAITRAWQQGIRHFDTAPYYGYGLSESRLGDVLSDLTRDSYTLSTKVGRVIEADHGHTHHDDGFIVDGRRAHFDYSRDGIMRSVEASLSRLRTDHIDVLLLHDIGALTHGAHHAAVLRQALDEALPAMAELRAQGVCDAIGIGVNEEAVCLEVMPQFPLDVIMLAGRYTLFEQQHSEGVMAQAQARGVAILAAGPYNSGLLGGTNGPGSFYNYAPADDATIERARHFYEILAHSHTEVGAAALQFPLAHPAVLSVVCGLRSVAEVDSATARMQAPIPAEAWHALREEGLLRSGTPTP
ncbi:aldo/keto reductase [Dyella dinghuensis]|uniref:Aldo/keto reductase n=1 Tax=Dyella dinghuensis TaxID=1920169 RepID=A0A432LV83_9GAMM|nr:aldo/keto reductase [Dyella dinghuensis]RUL65888.1 aldo/keto reductase [Dyella dinghuensis]